MSFDWELYEVFSWLPAKPLYRLSTVSKICTNYLSEPYFITKQCHNSSKKTEECLIIQDDSIQWSKPKKVLFSFLPENRSCCSIPRKSFRFLNRIGRILASSNGLVLCRTVNSNEPIRLILCNPSTRTYLPIDLPNERLARDLRCNGEVNITLICGNTFGSKNHEFTLDYSLFIMVPTTDYDWDSGFDVYSFEKSKWVLKHENILGGGRSLNFDEQVCCINGTYILSDFCDYYTTKSPYYWPYVHHYDIDNGTTTILALPHEARKNFFSCYGGYRLCGWERQEGNSWFESLCLVKYLDSLITIWVLEIEIKDTTSYWSWHKLLSIHIVDDLGINDCASWTNSFTIVRKNLIFANVDGEIYRYRLQGEDFGKLDMICKYGSSDCGRLRFDSYSTTLRPCSKDPNMSPLRIK